MKEWRRGRTGGLEQAPGRRALATRTAKNTTERRTQTCSVHRLLKRDRHVGPAARPGDTARSSHVAVASPHASWPPNIPNGEGVSLCRHLPCPPGSPRKRLLCSMSLTLSKRQACVSPMASPMTPAHDSARLFYDQQEHCPFWSSYHRDTVRGLFSPSFVV